VSIWNGRRGRGRKGVPYAGSFCDHHLLVACHASNERVQLTHALLRVSGGMGGGGGVWLTF